MAWILFSFSSFACTIIVLWRTVSLAGLSQVCTIVCYEQLLKVSTQMYFSVHVLQFFFLSLFFFWWLGMGKMFEMVTGVFFFLYFWSFT